MIEKILSTERIYSGRVVNLEVSQVELPDGKQQMREIIRHSGASAVVALDEDNRVLMVRQYRVAAGKVMLEIPAGLLNSSEDPMAAAVREFQEETGYKPTQIEALGGFHPAPGYTTEYINLYFATGLVESRLAGDADEFIEVDRLTIGEVMALIQSGEITDAKTIIAILLLVQRIGSP